MKENLTKYGVVAGVLVLAVVLLVATDYTGDVSRKGSPQPAGIHISSEPTNADVIIDGDSKGNTPKVFALTEGMHELQVSRRGYQTYVTTIVLGKGRNDPLSVTLEPLALEEE